MLPIVAIMGSGCGNTSSNGGAPTGSNGTDPGRSTTASTFRIKGPILAPSIKQGDRQTVSFTLERGSDFKQAVKLDVMAPKGLKAELSSKSVGTGDKAEFTISVEADADAPLGDQMIKVTGTPETGTATTLDVKVKVDTK